MCRCLCLSTSCLKSWKAMFWWAWALVAFCLSHLQHLNLLQRPICKLKLLSVDVLECSDEARGSVFYSCAQGCLGLRPSRGWVLFVPGGVTTSPRSSPRGNPYYNVRVHSPFLAPAGLIAFEFWFFFPGYTQHAVMFECFLCFWNAFFGCPTSFFRKWKKGLEMFFSAPLPVWGEKRQGLVFGPRGFSPGWLLAVEALRESGGFLPRGSWRKRKNAGVAHGSEFGLIFNISIKNMSNCIHLHINLVLWTRMNIYYASIEGRVRHLFQFLKWILWGPRSFFRKWKKGLEMFFRRRSLSGGRGGRGLFLGPVASHRDGSWP